MFTLISGLILLAIPFILVDLFSDKKRGFVYVLFFLFLSQTVLALLTQSLGIFYYEVIAGCMLSADIILLLIYLKIRAGLKNKISFNFKSIDWVVIAVAAVSLLSLYQVHYNYTGEINLATDQSVSYHKVKNMVYPYPYFSDEWYTISLAEGAIGSHSLPVKNLLNDSFFLNLELFFSSFVAQMMMILGLNPLLHYTVLSIFFNALIVVLAYLFLRINSVSKLASGICSLLMLSITCGANLPGLWQLIPLNSGIIFFLLSICFAEFKDAKTVLLSAVLASLFYPPLVPFYFTALVALFFCRTKMTKKRLLKAAALSVLSLLSAFLAAYLLLKALPIEGFTNYLFSRILFVSFVAPYIPQFYFYNIIPISAILLAIFGLYSLYKDKKWMLLSVFALGAIYWLVYSFTLYRFFAEYERAVVITSIIVVIISGFGLKRIEEYIRSKFQDRMSGTLKLAEIAVLLIFLLSVPFYTQGDKWKKNVYINPVNKSVVYPKSPANSYLTDDDLRIFKDIKSKRFLSVPWKGTVIGVATSNYPVLTKEGTISIGSNKTLNDFGAANCQNKKNIAKKLDLEYIYIYKFNCPGFQNVDKSKEGFFLYKVQ